MQKSKMFEQIKKWYEDGLWSKTKVKNAVLKGKITAEEYEEIVGEPFEGGESAQTAEERIAELEAALNALIGGDTE